MQNSRTAKTAKNAIFGFISQIVTILLGFASRTIFIYILGKDYLGINGLFTNILMLLSFAELGIGNAIIYSMYKPLAINDKEKIKSLMALYAKAYKTIGLLVFIAGLLVIPFMDYIIKDAPNIKEDINFVYFLFLVNTSLSYFFVYKKSIITADQKNYIVLFYQQIFRIAQTVGQIAFLLLTGEYIIFLIIQILFTLLDNIYVSKKADKMYPFLCESKTQPLENKERTAIISNVKALFLYKFGSVILNGSDNVIISAIIGITAVGINSNYVLVISSVTALVSQMMNGFTASIGNLNAIGNKENKERVFNKIFFVSAWLYGFCAIGLFLFLNKLMAIWLDESFVFPKIVVFSIVLHFYINNIHFVASTYRVTMGLFVQGKWAALAAAIINIVMSLWLGKLYGLAGVFFATSIARFFTTGIVDLILVYRYGFNKNPISYYTKYFSFLVLFVVLYFLMECVIAFIPIPGVFGFLADIATVSILFNLVMFLLFKRSRDFIEIKRSILNIAKKR